MRKDFFQHNSRDCFSKDVENRFSFPTQTSFYLVQGFGKEVLVQFDMDYCEGIAITTFAMRPSTPDVEEPPPKIKITVDAPEKPSFKMEITLNVNTKPYPPLDYDVTIGQMKWMKEACNLGFELVE